jgi:hypothetical protein
MSRLSHVASLLSALALPALVHPAMAQTVPTITKIRTRAHGDEFVVRITGTNFGVSPVKLPCMHCTKPEMEFFPFGDPAGPVNIKIWTDTEIELSGIQFAPGTTCLLAVRNDALGTDVSGALNLPGGAQPPNIRHVILRRFHGHTKITVNGRGFGSAPPGVPGTTDIPYFGFLTWVTGQSPQSDDYPWSAGGPGNAVELNYESWSDNRIVVSGFSNTYGDDGWVVKKGYAAAVVVYNVLPNKGGVGPGNAKALRIEQ